MILLPKFNCAEIEKFHLKVIKGQLITDCWGWNGAKAHGYAILKLKYKRYKASRVSYLLHYNADPKEMDVCHTCDNPACTNPLHLFLGTKTDNMQDCVLKDRSSRGQRNGNAKIKNEDVAIIMDLYYDKNYSQYEIADMYSMNQPSIHRIVTRKLWKHVQIQK